MVSSSDVVPLTYTFTDSRNLPFTSFYVGVKVNAVGGESQCGCTVAVGGESQYGRVKVNINHPSQTSSQVRPTASRVVLATM